MKQFQDITCRDFVSQVASKQPVPGGGATVALVSAVACALAHMAANFTYGKKKYQEFEEELGTLMEACTALEADFLAAIDEDAKAFKPLAEAYALPKDSEEERAYKEERLEEALKNAACCPLKLLEACSRAVDIIVAMERCSSKIMISDVGVAASYIVAAMESALLNIYINTAAMKNRAMAKVLNEEADKLMETYVPKAKKVYLNIKNDLYKN